MKPTQQQIQQFQKKILSFYQKYKRDLPWRKTTDPYKILLSELMLQQTQVTRVVTYFNKWILQWPTIIDLANAPRTEVLKAWMGLGYNTRAIRLHQAAEIIEKQYNGDVLKAISNYKEIPGIGPYTSKAVQIFSANKDLVTVDTNIRRILIHEFHLPEDISEKSLWELAERCLVKGKSRQWHNALMDYGALVLTSKKTGISPKTKQSRFEGSDRQIRAQILRKLLHTSQLKQELIDEFKIDRERLQSILDKMVKEELLIVKKNRYYIQK